MSEEQTPAVADDASPAQFDNLVEQPTRAAEHSNLDLVLDIPILISVEIGQTSMTIRNLLHLNQGSVVELNRLAGEPLDVKVNGKLVAHGEVVVVNEKFGIRLTDVVSPTERIEQLNEMDSKELSSHE